MTKEEARQLTSELARDYAGRIEATPEMYRQSWRVRLLLVAGQRTAIVYRLHEWESLLSAWQWFLEPEEVVPQASKAQPRPRVLIDGVVIAIWRDKLGYWKGHYRQDGRVRTKYLGKADPRERYPLWEGEQAS